MGATRTAWHVLLKALLTQRAPPRFEVRSEVPLSQEPLRADYLLIRRETKEGGEGQTLRQLWGLLPKDTILVFKSTGRPYRARNLDRLGAYLHLHYTDEPKRLEQRGDLCGALLVPTRTPSLDADVTALGLAWQDRGAGYWELTGGPFVLYVIEIDTVAEAEDDDLLRSFGHATAHTVEAKRWVSEQTGSTEDSMKMNELEGYDEVIQKVLQGLSPEQRLAGLAPEQALLALPDEVLRGFTESYLATLSEPTRAAIRARIGR